MPFDSRETVPQDQGAVGTRRGYDVFPGYADRSAGGGIEEARPGDLTKMSQKAAELSPESMSGHSAVLYNGTVNRK